jgi:hypothetical protein
MPTRAQSLTLRNAVATSGATVDTTTVATGAKFSRIRSAGRDNQGAHADFWASAASMTQLQAFEAPTAHR